MQAIIITCYKDKDNLIRLIDSFGKRVNIYVHIDKSSEELDIQKLRERFKDNKNLKFYSKYKISWGGYNHLLAIIDLMKIAYTENNSYFHIISGQDYLVKNVEEFLEFFENDNHMYMTLTENEQLTLNVKSRYTRGTVNSNLHNYKLIKYVDVVYGTFRNKNNIGKITDISKGMVWTSFPRDICEYVFDYIKMDTSFMKDLKHCIIPEEFFFQSIVNNSKYKNRIVKDNLRYTDWSYRNGSQPAYLDLTDYESITNSNCFFARKIDSTISRELICSIDDVLNRKGLEME